MVPAEYSQALYLLGRHSSDNRLALAATGNNKHLLLQRVKRMLNKKTSSPSVVKPLLIFFCALGLAVFGGRKEQFCQSSYRVLAETNLSFSVPSLSVWAVDTVHLESIERKTVFQTPVGPKVSNKFSAVKKRAAKQEVIAAKPPKVSPPLTDPPAAIKTQPLDIISLVSVQPSGN